MCHYSIRMEFQKIVNFFDTAFHNKDLPKFVTKKWIQVDDQSEKMYNPNTFLDTAFDNEDMPKFATKKWIGVGDQPEKKYQPNKKIGIKTSLLRSDLCDYSDAYIIVKGTITVVRPNNAKRNKAVTFKNNATFLKCISKINGVKIDNAEYLDVAMSMYNVNFFVNFLDTAFDNKDLPKFFTKKWIQVDDQSEKMYNPNTFLDTAFDNEDMPKFATKKWIGVGDQPEKKYQPNKKIGIKTSLLRSDLCDYSDAYIIVKGTITVVRPNNAKRNKAVTFKNNATFLKCISKINGVKIDNAEYLDVVMPKYKLLEYSKNYKKATGSLWNY